MSLMENNLLRKLFEKKHTKNNLRVKWNVALGNLLKFEKFKNQHLENSTKNSSMINNVKNLLESRIIPKKCEPIFFEI